MNRLHTSQEELLTFALDQNPLSSEARQHLDCCPLCQHQVACYQKTVTYLVSKLYRWQCPSGTMLSLYCLPGELSAAEQEQITNHLATCPLCATEMAETRLFLEV